MRVRLARAALGAAAGAVLANAAVCAAFVRRAGAVAGGECAQPRGRACKSVHVVQGMAMRRYHALHHKRSALAALTLVCCMCAGPQCPESLIPPGPQELKFRQEALAARNLMRNFSAHKRSSAHRTTPAPCPITRPHR